MAQDIGSAGTSRRAAPRDHLAAIVESSDDAILSEDLDGIITSWNAAAERLYGYTAEEAIGCPACILVPEQQQDEMPKVIARLRRGERVAHYEAVRQAKNGRRLIVSVTVSAIRDDDGRIVGASEVGREITQRKQAEQDLARQLADQKRLREISSRLSLSGDVQTLYRELIDAAMEITGAACGTMQTVDGETGELCLLETHGIPQQMRNEFARVSPKAATSCGVALRRGERVLVDYANDARVAGTEEARAHLDAGIRSAQSTPLVARSGRLVGMLTTQWRRSSPIADRQLYLLDILARQASDLIERVQADETLRQNDERLRFTLEATEFGSWELDLSEAKPSATRRSLKHDEIFGYDQAVPTWNYDIFLEHVLEEDRDYVSRELDTALHETGRWEFECRIRRADNGQVRWIWARGQVIEAWCEPRRMLGLVQDITERKEVVAQLEELTQTLEQRVMERTAEAKQRARQLQLMTKE
ncbi:MAG: PAS domain S-box protein, partial [Phycisphaeraceae bacterium]